MLNIQSRYVPILKWRMGEYQAIFKLDDSIKDIVMPLIIIPPIEFDFEEMRLKKTAHEHIETFPKRYNTKWHTRLSFLDMDQSLHSSQMNDNRHVIKFVFDELRNNGEDAIPVVRLNYSAHYIQQISEVIDKNSGLCLRLELDDLMSQNLNREINNLLSSLSIGQSHTDLVLDLGKPESYEPYEGFANALAHHLNKIGRLNNYRSLTLAGTSLRVNKINPPGGTQVRHEWQLYKAFLNNKANKCPLSPYFGDYTIETPEFISMDMRYINPAGKIIYTGDDEWYIRKGTALRGNESQMQEHCKAIVSSEYYKGQAYSFGDKRILETASGKQNYGTHTTWKQVGVNHHITNTVLQLSNFHVT